MSLLTEIKQLQLSIGLVSALSEEEKQALNNLKNLIEKL